MDDYIEDAARRLIEASKRLQEVNGRLRAVTERMAGCDLSDWSDQTIERYINLACAFLGRPLIFPPDPPPPTKTRLHFTS